MFTPALAEAIGGTAGRATDIIVQSICFALILGFIYFLMVRLQKKQAREYADVVAASVLKAKQEMTVREPGPIADEADTYPTLRSAMPAAETGSDISSLMAAVRDQAIEIRGQHAKTVSNLSLDLDVLTDRLATIEPLVSKAMEAAGKGESAVAFLTSSNDDLKRKLSEAERDLAFYRPLSIKLEDDLRGAQNHLAEAERKSAALEAEHARAQGAINELYHRMASAEIARQRTSEENAALVHKLNEHDSTIQSLQSESAHLKSESVSLASELERAEREAKVVGDKYAAEREESSRTKAALRTLEVQFNQFRRDHSAQIEQSKERERALTEALSIKEKQFYDSEIKRSALDSKIDFLTRTNQRLREDLRRHIDHIGNLESSNRKLLDSLARNSAVDPQDGEKLDSATMPRAAPKLRAVTDSQNGVSASLKPLAPDSP